MMIVAYGIIFLYVFLPVLGGWIILSSGQNFFVTPTWEMFWNNLIFAIITFIILWLVSRKRIIVKTSFLPQPNRLLGRCFVFSFLGMLFVFSVSGYKFLFLGIDRGEIRIGMGMLGPLYTLVVGYFLPAVVALAYMCIIQPKFNRVIKLKFYLVILFAVLVAVFTGYKSTIVSIMLPVVTIYFMRKRNLLRVVQYIAMFVGFLVISTMLVRGTSMGLAWDFMLHRMSIMTSAGTLGVWQEFPDGVSVQESIKLSYGALGNKLSTLMLGGDFSDIGVLKTNLSRYVSYLVYPDSDAVLSGTVNLTVTNFGEAVYIFGGRTFGYVIYAIFAGFFSGWILLKFKRGYYESNILFAIMHLIYFYAVILPWFNSTSIWSLIAPTTVFYMLLNYIAILLLMKGQLK